MRGYIFTAGCESSLETASNYLKSGYLCVKTCIGRRRNPVMGIDSAQKRVQSIPQGRRFSAVTWTRAALTSFSPQFAASTKAASKTRLHRRLKNVQEIFSYCSSARCSRCPCPAASLIRAGRRSGEPRPIHRLLQPADGSIVSVFKRSQLGKPARGIGNDYLANAVPTTESCYHVYG